LENKKFFKKSWTKLNFFALIYRTVRGASTYDNGSNLQRTFHDGL
jgi:hypothetical protein